MNITAAGTADSKSAVKIDNLGVLASFDTRKTKDTRTKSGF